MENNNNSGYKHNIAITGLTAAGKTTHSLVTVNEFSFKYVSSSALLRKLAKAENEVLNDYWTSNEGQAITQLSTSFGIDQELSKLEDSQNETVFDCRSLPWLTRNSILSIWIDSSLESRVMKAIISYGKDAQKNISEVRQELVLKDETDRENLKQSFGFDFFKDHDPIDVNIDISSFVTEASIKASWRSIQLAQDIISAVVGLYLTNEDFYRLRLKCLEDELGSTVFRRYSPKFSQLIKG